jgi:hypothetical protein
MEPGTPIEPPIGHPTWPPVAVTRPAQFSFVELAAWRDEMFGVLDIEGVASLDLDERRNRVVVEVFEPAARADVESYARATSVPRSAILVEDGEREVPHATLLDIRDRPTPSGFRFYYHSSDGYDDCTLGFSARLDGYEGFFTASHCSMTGTWWQQEYNVWLTQPSSSSSVSDLIAIGELDPPSWGCGTFPYSKESVRCRYSDAAFNYASAPWGLGQIARPTEPGPNGQAGPLTISSTWPRFDVIMQIIPIYQGLWVSKVGKSSGWTMGSVDGTCVDVSPQNGGSIKFLCQGHANYYGKAGDSGSPVFALGWGTGVMLVGLHHLGTGGPGGGRDSTFSTMADIRWDFCSGARPPGAPQCFAEHSIQTVPNIYQ